MKLMPTWSVTAIQALIVVALPVLLVLTNVRLLMTHAFPQIEYTRPGFPADPYGFTTEERLKWSKIAVDYLLNDAGIEFLGDLRFDDGTPLYNQRELEHMVDVKVVVRVALAVWMIAGVAVLGGGAALWFTGNHAALRAGFSGGGILTLTLLGGVILYILINFNAFFTQFHEVFFESGTWMFLYSDTLIRLFPLQFWSDAFIFVGGAAIVEALVVWGLAWRLLVGR